MNVHVEIAVEDLAGMEIAARGGADRVELCTDLDQGGLTPGPELVAQCSARARELVQRGDARPHFDIHTLIRCRAGTANFLDQPGEFQYDATDIERMTRQAHECVMAGAAGVVIGALKDAHQLDREALEAMRDAALRAGAQQQRGITLTCHRAVDALASREDRCEAMRSLLQLGFHRVLSSGGAARAVDGREDLAAMVAATDDIVEVCAGSGITPAVIASIVHSTGVSHVHMSARGTTPSAGASAGTGIARTRTSEAIVVAAVDAAGAL